MTLGWIVFIIGGVIGLTIYFYSKIKNSGREPVKVTITGVVFSFLSMAMVLVVLLWIWAGIIVNTYYAANEDKTEWVYECYWNVVSLQDNSHNYVRKHYIDSGTTYDYYIPTKFGKQKFSLAADTPSYNVYIDDTVTSNYRLERWQKRTKWEWFNKNFPDITCGTMYIFKVPKNSVVEEFKLDAQ